MGVFDTVGMYAETAECDSRSRIAKLYSVAQVADAPMPNNIRGHATKNLCCSRQIHTLLRAEPFHAPR